MAHPSPLGRKPWWPYASKVLRCGAASFPPRPNRKGPLTRTPGFSAAVKSVLDLSRDPFARWVRTRTKRNLSSDMMLPSRPVPQQLPNPRPSLRTSALSIDLSIESLAFISVTLGKGFTRARMAREISGRHDFPEEVPVQVSCRAKCST